MAFKYQNRYRIPSTRLQNWNYGWNAIYFVTICTKDRQQYFGEIIDGEMHLSSVGAIADVLWHELTNHFDGIELDAFVVMPNHIHGIVVINDGDNGTTNGNNGTTTGDNGTTTGDNGTTNGNNGTTTVETTHALSLQPSPQSAPQPSPQSAPQPSPQSAPQSPQTIGQQRFQHQGAKTLSSIVGSYKSAVSRHAHRLGYEFAWQSRFYDNIIRNDDALDRIQNYIYNNPDNWNEDKFNPL